MDKNIDYKLKDAYKNLKDMVGLLGHDLQKKHKYMDEIRKIRDDDS